MRKKTTESQWIESLGDGARWVYESLTKSLNDAKEKNDLSEIDYFRSMIEKFRKDNNAPINKSHTEPKT